MRDLGIATLVGVILASMGPFGTYVAGPLQTRLAYWVGLLWCSLLFYSPAASGAKWLAVLLRIPGAVALGGALVLAALPMSARTSFVAARVWGAEADYSALTWFLQVLVVSLPIAAVQFLLDSRQPTVGAHKASSLQTSPSPGSLAKTSGQTLVPADAGPLCQCSL